jgi:hypothetical protein
VVILGIAGGNGLHRVDLAVTTRIPGTDLNPSYLECRSPPLSPHSRLELYCLELAEKIVDLRTRLHALIFEHAGIVRCRENAARLVA